jgi:transcriptional regulator GlxA family with amidase domain
MPSRQKIIVYLVSSPGDLISLVSITSVFSYPTIDGEPAYIPVLLSTLSEREVRGIDGVTVTNCIPYTDYDGAIDTLIVLGGTGVFEAPALELIQWIRERASRARRIVSVCTGAFVLAPTGLLDGKRTTTHWHHSHRLAQQYPKILMEQDQIFIQDGNVYSTAGVTAGIDMALAIVEEDFGHKMVASIAHALVLYVRRPGNEVQYSAMLAQQDSVGGSPMRSLPAWAKANLTEKLGVNTLAKIVSMTPRTFARHFELHFKMTPARWVQALRVEAVCEHLGTDDLPLKVIAGLTGFRDEKSLRRAFVQQLAITPKEYRESFGLSRGRFATPPVTPRTEGCHSISSDGLGIDDSRATGAVRPKAFSMK